MVSEINGNNFFSCNVCQPDDTDRRESAVVPLPAVQIANVEAQVSK